MLVLSPRLRLVTYVLTFELLAVVLSTILLMVLSSTDPLKSLPVAIAVSLIAVAWNYVFNRGFERWERRRGGERTLLRRAVHAVLYEVGLMVFIVPLYAVWYRVSLGRAFLMELSILVFFLVYTFLFTLAFDVIFARPSATEGSASSAETQPTPATARGSRVLVDELE